VSAYFTSLASQFGELSSRTNEATRQFSRLRSEADIQRARFQNRIYEYPP